MVQVCDTVMYILYDIIDRPFNKSFIPYFLHMYIRHIGDIIWKFVTLLFSYIEADTRYMYSETFLHELHVKVRCVL